MKKVLILLLAAIICLQTVGAVGELSYDRAIEWDTNLTNPAIAHWGGYIFAAHSTGIKIVDVMTDDVVATWTLSATDVPGVSSRVPKAIAVSDDYIVVTLAAKWILVFPNEGTYTNTTPKLIRRLGGSAAFNKEPLIMLEDNMLYAFDLVTSGGAIGVENNSVVLWKADLDCANEFARNGASSNNYSKLYENIGEYVSLGVVAKADSLWSEVVSDGDYIYAVTFNNQNTAPYKKLYFHKINKETAETESCILYDGDLNSMMVAVEFDEVKTIDDITGLEIFEVGNPENSVLVSNFSNSQRKISITKNSAGGCTVTVYLTSFSAIASASKLGIDEETLANGGKTIALMVGDEEHPFVYNSNSTTYTEGALAISENLEYVYAVTNVTGNRAVNELYKVDITEGLAVVDNQVMVGTGNNGYLSGYKDIVENDGQIIGFVTGTSYFMPVMDFSNYTSISYSISVPGTIVPSSANAASRMIEAGNKIYYAFNDRTGIGVVGDVTAEEKIGIKNDNLTYPIIAYGETSGSGATVVADGMDYTAEAKDGIWRIPIYKLPTALSCFELNGEAINIAVTDKEIEFSDVAINEGTITFKAENNTDLYKNVKTNIIKFAAVVYGKDGEVKDIKEATKTCAYGEATAVTIIGITSEAQDTVVLLALNADGAPISDGYNVTDDEMFLSEEIIIGNAELSVPELLEIPASKTIEIRGGYTPGRRVLVKVELVSTESTTVGYSLIKTDENGQYSFDYSYADDTIAPDNKYKVTVSATGITAEGFASAEVTPADTEVFDGQVTYIKENVSTNQEMLSYLQSNEELAFAVGVDISSSNFTGLNNTRKCELAGIVLVNINNDTPENIRSAYATKLAELSLAQSKDDGWAEIQKVSSSGLTATLEKYKEAFEISDELWSKYKNSGNVKNINDYFIKKAKLNSIADVAGELEKAIEKAPTTAGGGAGGGGGGGGGATKDDKKDNDSEIIYQAPKDPNDVYKPIQPKTFDDVPITHWAYEPITILATRGVVNGIGDESYGPEIDLTREAFVKMLVETLGLKANGNALLFTDVESSAWYTEYVNIASSIGLVNGYDGKFGIGDGLTREQMATMLYRATEIAGIKLEDKVTVKDFTDNAEIGDYALTAVKELCEAGILNGMDNGSYSPKTICNRAMAAKVIYQILTIR